MATTDINGQPLSLPLANGKHYLFEGFSPCNSPFLQQDFRALQPPHLLEKGS